MTVFSRLGAMALGLGAGVVALDQASKHWVLTGLDLPARISVPVVGPLYLTMVWNQGVSFGLFRADIEIVRWVLTAFSLGVALMLGLWARKVDRPLMAVGLGLVMGGAIGNAIDRIRFGAVVDFLDVTRLMFPWVFNIADAGITIGVIFLLLDSNRKEATNG